MGELRQVRGHGEDKPEALGGNYRDRGGGSKGKFSFFLKLENIFSCSLWTPSARDTIQCSSKKLKLWQQTHWAEYRSALLAL